MFGPIAQFGDSRRLWSTFLHKAARGSAKATDWLNHADMAVAEHLGGRTLVEEMAEADYEKVMGGALPASPPFDGVRELLSEAYTKGALTTYVVARDMPFCGRTHYARLWERGTEVEPALLLHDAAHYCYRNWNGAGFRRLINSDEISQSAYNSQDAVAGMLYISSI